jgi:hypothetical protein
MVTSKVIWILVLVSAVGDIGGFVKSTDVGSPKICNNSLRDAKMKMVLGK